MTKTMEDVVEALISLLVIKTKKIGIIETQVLVVLLMDTVDLPTNTVLAILVLMLEQRRCKKWGSAAKILRFHERNENSSQFQAVFIYSVNSR